jgi:hypothetical protein
VEDDFKTAAAMFEEMHCPFDQAVVQLEHHEWLVEQGRADEEGTRELSSGARATFDRLGARPYLDRLDRTAIGATVP